MIDQESKKKMWKTFEIFCENENFTFKEMHISEKSMGTS